MPHKRVLDVKRLRRIPAQFSWIDQRLVREHYIERCDAPALALYLFLVTVADVKGLSYYGDAALCRCLSLDERALRQARARLIGAGLIAYEAPLYQVLSLAPLPAPRHCATESIGATLKRVQARLQDKAP
jgi:hypothetical protein